MYVLEDLVTLQFRVKLGFQLRDRSVQKKKDSQLLGCEVTTKAIKTMLAIQVFLKIWTIFVKPMLFNIVLGRIDNVYGDRHLVCTLRASEPEFEEQAIVAA